MNPILELKNLKYRSGTQYMVQITAELMPQCVINLSGPSGAGKTTLLRILARLSQHESGEVFLKGTSWNQFSPTSWRRKVHYFSQKPVIFDGTVQDNILKPFELSLVRKDESINLFLMEKYMDGLLLPKALLDRDARVLSGGEAARMALVRTLMVQPEIILLDEPLAALDSRAVEGVLAVLTEWCLEKRDRGIIIVSHTVNLENLPGYQIIDLSDKLVPIEGEAVE